MDKSLFTYELFHYICIGKSYLNKQSDVDHGN